MTDKQVQGEMRDNDLIDNETDQSAPTEPNILHILEDDE